MLAAAAAATAEFGKRKTHGRNHSTLKTDVASSFSKHRCLYAKLHGVTP